MNNNDSLSLKRLGLRFISGDTEHRYRFWRHLENLPVLRLTVAASVPPWLATPFIGYLWEPDIDWLELWSISYTLMAPMFALLFVLSYTNWRQWATWLLGPCLAISGCAMLWLITTKIEPAMGIKSIGPSVAVTMIFASFGLFMRLTPGVAILSIAPFCLVALIQVISGFQKDLLEPVVAYGYVMCLGTIFFFVSLMSGVNERFFRRAFIKDQVIHQQNDQLEQSSNLIRRYVPAAVADHIAQGKGERIDTPQRRRVTILFSDIVGFTDMADRLDAESMTQILNEYMAAMADIVEAHGGTLNEFSGDGLMAVFGAPNEMEPEGQALSAVKAAQEMQSRLPALNEGWLKLGIGEPMKIRIGINTGVLSVGSFGSEGRMTYTAIGLQTNIAARIQSHCEPGGILLSDASWHLVKNQIECEPKGEVECKGVHFPVKVHAPKVA